MAGEADAGTRRACDAKRNSTIKQVIFGKPRDLSDRSIFHTLSLIPFLAWVGLGADGLSSSAYGPEEAYRALGEHKYLAVLLMLMTAFTVLIISAAYKRIIEEFPHGGGGYVVASKLLGPRIGVVSGCALLVDYVLTITISIAAAGDAVFSFLPLSLHHWKIPVEVIVIALLTCLNIRGVRESVLILTPIFIVFLITHLITIVGGIVGHIPEMAETAASVSSGFRAGTSTLGPVALMMLLIHAYSLGGGTYTGIEAVSNGIPIMREPKALTARRTMTYMALSLAFTASGLLLCYLLWKVNPVEGKTMNAVLFGEIVERYEYGQLFVIVTLLSEGLLLVVAAQAGFIDGPRVLANMANDSWVPRRFAALSDRLTTSNGIVLMGITSLAALLYTHGNVSKLVVMYSINVFLTFSLSIGGMLLLTLRRQGAHQFQSKNVLLFSIGLLLCLTILAITIFEKFAEGGWITLATTCCLVLTCMLIKQHYLAVARQLRALYSKFDCELPSQPKSIPLDANDKTAAIMVAVYGGLGIHTVRSILETFPNVYRNFVFISVGVVDSGKFKGEDEIEQLTKETTKMLERYVEFGHSLGIASTYRLAIGTDVVDEGSELCRQVRAEFPQATFFTGKIIFEKEKWFQRLLHNETAFTLQKRLQLAGLTMVILPAKVA